MENKIPLTHLHIRTQAMHGIIEKKYFIKIKALYTLLYRGVTLSF